MLSSLFISVYTEYAYNIRKEYNHLSNNQYCEGRTKVINRNYNNKQTQQNNKKQNNTDKIQISSRVMGFNWEP